MKQGDLVFVYGSLLSGLHNHTVIDGAHKLGDTLIAGMTMVSLGSYPALLPRASEMTIVGEVYEVASDDMAQRLDWLEGYPEFYNRKQVSTEYGKAWVYYIKSEPHRYSGAPVVSNGNWRDYISTTQL